MSLDHPLRSPSIGLATIHFLSWALATYILSSISTRRFSNAEVAVRVQRNHLLQVVGALGDL